VSIVVEKQIFWLQVSMDDHVPVAVVNSGDDLLEEAARLVLFQLRIHNLLNLFHLNQSKKNFCIKKKTNKNINHLPESFI